MIEKTSKPVAPKTSAAKPRGFVLLYAVMTSSIVLAVGMSIISIALKQLSIANLGRESQYAFYAANTGAECALYWDFHGVVSEVAGPGTYYRRLSVFRSPFVTDANWPEVQDEDAGQVSCARTKIILEEDKPEIGVIGGWVSEVCDGLDPGECESTSFTVFLGRQEDGSGDIDPLGACARVTIEKTRGTGSGLDFVPDAAGDNLQTTIDSRGYNYCSENNSRRVERGLRFTY